MLGNGDGTFAPRTTFTSGSRPTSVAVADVNSDGRSDLLYARSSYGINSASVLLGNGNGTFASPVHYAVGTNPHSIKAADFNGDGRLDLVTANDGSNNVSVLLGNGNGTFGTSTAYAAGRVPKSVDVGDLDGDGDLDLVTANTAGNGDGVTGNPDGDNVSVLLGNGNGTFGTQTKYFVGQTPFSVEIEDFDEDGRRDLVTANYGDNQIATLRNTGTG
jgi:hypothetical protein